VENATGVVVVNHHVLVLIATTIKYDYREDLLVFEMVMNRGEVGGGQEEDEGMMIYPNWILTSFILPLSSGYFHSR